MRREYSIYRTLKALSRQRVALILQPGNVWVIEKSIPHDERTEENLRTCHLRSWVEPIANAIPRGQLTAGGGLPPGFVFSEQAPLYRLTDSGWNAIHRTHVLALLSLIVALLALGVAVIGLKP
jgi:hypothetical protein